MFNTYFLPPQSVTAVKVAECNRQHLLSGAVLVLGRSVMAGLAEAQAKEVERQERVSLMQSSSQWWGEVSEVSKSRMAASLNVISTKRMWSRPTERLVVKKRVPTTLRKIHPTQCLLISHGWSGFGIEWDESCIESRNTLTFS